MKNLFLVSLTLLLFFSCEKQAALNEVKFKLGRRDLSGVVNTWQTLSDGSSFSNYAAFDTSWNYLYPWGSDHNGSARMYGSSTDHSHIFLNSDSSLTLMATRQADSTPSTSSPYLPIKFHSGTVYSKYQVNINSAYPYWELSGNFMAPTTQGTWPAFWATGATVYPPESDIMEIKGTTSVWQNTLDSLGHWQTVLTTVATAPTVWHNYKVSFNLVQGATGTWTDSVDCIYYIDNVITAVHRAKHFANKAMNIIIDMQMEGGSGTYVAAADTINMKAKNVILRKGTTPFDPAAWYEIINRSTSQIIAVPNASTTEGAALMQHTWQGGIEQQWEITGATGSNVAITNRNSNQVMAIGSASLAPGAAVIQWDWLGGNEQQWVITSIGGGYYEIINSNSGLAMTLSGNAIVQSSYTGSTAQQWEIIRLL